jgi:hypothetical protein
LKARCCQKRKEVILAKVSLWKYLTITWIQKSLLEGHTNLPLSWVSNKQWSSKGLMITFPCKMQQSPTSSGKGREVSSYNQHCKCN